MPSRPWIIEQRDMGALHGFAPYDFYGFADSEADGLAQIAVLRKSWPGWEFQLRHRDEVPDGDLPTIISGSPKKAALGLARRVLRAALGED